MINSRFCRLTVIKEMDRIHYKTTSSRAYLCRCDCGNEITSTPSNLRRGATKSCGCLKKETAHLSNKTHGLSRTKEYTTWASIKHRCYNIKYKEFHLYGGRGIKMSPIWRESFIQFISDMGLKPSDKHSIDRINNDDDYRKENCRWVLPSTQTQNRRCARKILFHGQEMSIKDFSEIINKNYFSTYYLLVRKGVSAELVAESVNFQSNISFEPTSLVSR